eukprot:Blabericola_migrator_1__1525@NODE_1400_length_4624_cov_15_837832_g936_i0_p1_GENE_NODE_1400_length_4624_cov_15_837832_g936_i0NODE_1400_length_4624_cov_15_837832_g936_i0_p1_ORF_typecomplete_len468_score49_16_NODE_1400_length_4624_cov_15_837832_g936_i010802483
MAKAVRLTPNSHPKIPVGDLITVGLVCVAGDDVRSDTVEWWRASDCRQQTSGLRNWRSESRPHSQRQTSEDSNWRQPSDGAARGQTLSFGRRPTSIQDASAQSSTRAELVSREGARKGMYNFNSKSFPIAHDWRSRAIRERYDNPLYEPGSRAQLLTHFCSRRYPVPDFFQIRKDTSPDNVLEILRRGLSNVAEEYHELCANLVNAIDAHNEAIASFTKQEKSCKSTESERLPAFHPDREHLFLSLRNVVKGALFPQMVQSGAATPIEKEASSAAEALRLRDYPASEEHYSFLCFLEPALTWLTLTADEYHSQHLLPDTMARLKDVRTALLRHHVLMRLSSIESMTDNEAAEYCAVFISIASQKTDPKPGAFHCIHSLVRLCSLQQIAIDILEALKNYKKPLSLNICLIIAVDILGCRLNCPLVWEDIVDIFEAKMVRPKYTELVKAAARKLQPWLEVLAGSHPVHC